MILVEIGLVVVFAFFALRWSRVLVDGASIVPEPFTDVFRRELFRDPPAARRLAHETSWVGRLATTALEALDAERDVGLEMASEYKHIRQDAYRPLNQLRQLARGSVFMGLLFAMAEVVWARVGSHGLDALRAGVAESEAEGRAILAVAIGFASAAVLLSLRRQLRRLVRDTLSGCDKFRERLENQVHRHLDEGWTLDPTE